MPTFCFVGHGRHGKDECCKAMTAATGLTFAGTTSLYLAEYMAGVLGVSRDEAYARRHESDKMRTLWYDEANRLRDNDPTKLARMALAVGSITGGLRSHEEMVGCRVDGLFDLIVWVRDPRKPENDPTMKFGPEMADLVVLNDGTLEELWAKVGRLGRLITGGDRC